jgi:RimJ/RimL family protein N-acetyltransferase
MREIPVIETPRLVLRGHRLADFQALADVWASPEVTRHIGGHPSTAEESWARLMRYAGHWSMLDYGFWAITLKDGGGFIGEVGFADFHRGIDYPDGPASPEAGWVLATSAQGRGLATEAMQGALVWAQSHLPGGSSMCIIDPGNAPSIRLALKCGYRETCRTNYRGEETAVFRR